MFRNTLLAVCSLIAITGNAQYLTNLNYELSFGDLTNATYYKEAASKTVLDGNYLYHVTYTSGTPTGNFLLVKKHHIDGTPTWEQTFGNLGPITFHHGVDITVDGSGNVYVVGATEHSTEGYNALVVKYNSSGVKQWDYSYNSTGTNDDYATAIDVDASGNCYVTGQVDEGAVSDAFVLKLDQNGNFGWASSYDYDGQKDGAVLITYVDANTIEMMAITQDDGNIEELSKVVYNSSGVQQSANRSNISVDNMQLRDLKRLSTGSYVACGAVPDVVNGDQDLAVYQFSGTMTTTWSYVYDENGFDDIASSITLETNGDIYISGTVGVENAKTSLISLKLTSAGILDWKDIFQHLIHFNTTGLRGTLIESNKYLTVGTIEEDDGTKNTFVALNNTLNGEIIWFWQTSSENQMLPNFVSTTADNDIVIVNLKRSSLAESIKCFSLAIYNDTRVFTISQSVPSTFVDDQLIVNFDSDVLKTDVLNNQQIQFGGIEDFLTSDAIAELDAHFNQTLNLDIIVVKKIFRRLSPNSTTSISRQNAVTPIPKLWTCLLFDFGTSVDEVSLLDDFANDNLDFISYSSLNFKGASTLSPGDQWYQVQGTLHETSYNAHIHAEDAWDIETGKYEIRMGIIETAMDWSHEDFQITPNGRLKDSKFADGYSYRNDRPLEKVKFTTSHGTGVSGVAGALTNNKNSNGLTIGVAGMAGGNMEAGVENPGASLWGFIYGGDMTSSDIAEMIFDASKNNPSDSWFPGYACDVINCSWTFELELVRLVPLLTQAYQFANDQGCIMVTSADNQDKDVAYLPDSYPDDWVLKVGGSNTIKQRRTGTNGSAWGHNLDVLGPSTSNLHYTTVPNNSYATAAGNSFAAPLVSGLSSLILSKFNYGRNDSRNLYPEDVEWIIEQSAEDLIYNRNGIPVATQGYDDESGWGLIRADYALQMLSRPNFRLDHVVQTTSSETAIEENGSTDIFVEFTDWHFHERDKTAILEPDVTYKTNIYEVEIEVTVPWPTWHVGTYEILNPAVHDLSTSSEFEIFEKGFWELNSRSDLWQYDAVNHKISPYDDIRFVVEPYKDGNYLRATVKGHIVYVKKVQGTLKYIKEWFPHSNLDDHTLAFSVLYTLDWSLNEASEPLSKISIYPNPANNFIHFENQDDFPIEDLNLLNTLGQSILNFPDIDPMSVVTINFNDLASGMYFVRFRKRQKSFIHKIEIRR